MRPSRELACISRVEKASAREAVSHSVVLAVNLADGPFAACLRQLLAQVVAFSKEDARVGPVEAPKRPTSSQQKAASPVRDRGVIRKISFKNSKQI